MPEERFLGKRKPVNKPTLAIADFLKVQEIPEHPSVVPGPPIRWTMDRNDQAGTCVVAGMNHTLQTIAWHLGVSRTPWNDSEILKLYQTQNPNFKDWSQGGTDADEGMVLQYFLQHLITRGDILAFGKIDHDNAELIRGAVFIGMSIVTGEMLMMPHQNQQTWDATTSQSVWGGHCTNTVGYRPGEQVAVSWGDSQPMTDAFVQKHMDEAWLVLTSAMINTPSFRNGFDLAGFADAIADLTNGKVIVPVPPVLPNEPIRPPTPTPDPPQPGDPAWTDFPFSKMDKWAAKLPKDDSKYERAAKLAYRQWKANHRVDERNANTRREVFNDAGESIGYVELGTGQFWASQG